MNFFIIAWVIGFVFWIAETAFFGFNATAQSDIERFADSVAVALMAMGGLGMFISFAVQKGLTEFERISNDRSQNVIREMKAESDRLTDFRVADTARRKADLDRAVEMFKEIASEAVVQGGFVPKLEEEEEDGDCMANDGLAPKPLRDHYERFHCNEHKTGEPHEEIDFRKLPIKIEVHEVTIGEESEQPKPETSAKPAGKGKQSKK